ncbi:MAG: hypothetical protein JXL97_13920 [Bacteroidales bacterium]|nr:hypothetical protein [Bacteroidales bacterium]
MQKSLIIVIFLLITNYLYSQVETEKRIEFDVENYNSSYYFYEFNSLGAILISEQGSSNKYKVNLLNQNLDIVETKYFEIPDKENYTNYFSNDSTLYLLFKARNGSYTLVVIDVKDMIITKKESAFPKKTYVYNIMAIDDMVFFEISIKRNNSITTLNLNTSIQSVIPIFIKGYKEKNTSIENVQISENTKEYFVFVNAYKGNEHNLYVLKYDKNAELKETFNLSENLEQKLSSVSVSAISKNEYIFSGTYSSKKVSSGEGLYFCKIINGKTEFIKFYNFMEFDEFLSYLPQRKIDKIEKKKKRKKDNGKSYSLNYLLASHEIIQIDNNYYYLGEAFYPTYRTETYTDSNGQTQTRQVFDGYQYTHATLVAFDELGNKLWDKTFEMWPSYKPYFVKKFITMTIIDQNINLLFINRSNIVSIAFSVFGENKSEKDYDFLETGNENDKLRYSLAEVVYWYNNYFIAYGFQKIKNNTDETSSKKRKVFFVNKISYR